MKASRMRALARTVLALRFQAEAQPHMRMLAVDKREYLAQLATRGGYSTFVETGTFMGSTADRLSRVCDRVVTIEIEPGLYRRALERFEGNAKIEVLFGDSSQLLPQVLRTLTSPALFWLDGHASGGITGGLDTAPIMDELRAIIAHPVKSHAIVVDDARMFRGRDGYPRLREVVSLVRDTSNYRLVVNSDLMRIENDDI